ncbi:MAG: hypothetical protein IKH78_09330 [Ruminococcus sp.]|nr:hypothetical protein [Ruminococcus sp.]
MKNVFRKLTAAVMAFTLLGAGTTFTNTVSPKTNALTASAATVDPNTPHNHGQCVYHTREVSEYSVPVKGTFMFRTVVYGRTYYFNVYDVVRCQACGGVVKRTLTYTDSWYEDYSAFYTYRRY